MTAIIKRIFYLGPLIFGIGFIAPLTATIIRQAAWQPPFGVEPLLAGLFVGGAWGLYAQWRGRWL